MSIAITIAAIILSLALGVIIGRAQHKSRLIRPTSADLAALQADYSRARQKHQPSKVIGRKLVKARTEQIKQECV